MPNIRQFWMWPLRTASYRFAPQLNLKGIILNPDTDQDDPHPKFIDAMKQVKAAQTQPQPKPGVQGQEKDIKMSRAQFELFARRTCEWGIIPGAVHKEKAEFMKKLEEQQGRFMAALYRQPYGDKIPFPYSEKDFDIMILDIDEETCVASIVLPKRILLRIWLLLCISYGIRRMMKCIILPSSKDRRAKRMFCADLVRTENVRNCRLHRQLEMKFLQCWILYVKRKKKRKFRIICHVFHDSVSYNENVFQHSWKKHRQFVCTILSVK